MKQLKFETYDAILQVLRRIRHDARLRQTDLAQKIGVSGKLISAFEVGYRTDGMSVTQLIDICAACNVSVVEFFQRVEAVARGVRSEDIERRHVRVAPRRSVRAAQRRSARVDDTVVAEIRRRVEASRYPSGWVKSGVYGALAKQFNLNERKVSLIARKRA